MDMKNGWLLSGIKAIPRGLASIGRKALTIVRDAQNFFPITLIRSTLSPVDSNRGLSSNAVMAPVMWIQRTFTEAELVVQRKKPDGMWERIDHEMQSLIDNPNSAYDGDALWKATVLSYVMSGNAYWWKVRNDVGDVVALWYLPHWAIRPWSPFIDARGGITSYLVSIMGTPVELLPRDVVHFRFGIDPEDPRLGLSPLASVMTEVETDMLSATFSEDIVRNHGVPGMLVSPKDAAARPSEKQVDELKKYLETAFTGPNRGKTMVMGVPTEVAQFGFDPSKLMLASLRDLSEERICAILGVPAAVVGFGAGLQSTKVGATMRELVKLAWVTCLIPMQKTLARTVTTQLLHEDFVGQAKRFRARFDMSEASSFQEEFDLRVTSTMKLVDSNVLRIDRAQQILGLEVDPSRAVYLNEVPGATKAPIPATDPTAADTTAAADAPSEPPADAPKALQAPVDTRDLIAAIADRWLPVIRTHASNGNGNGRHKHAPN